MKDMKGIQFVFTTVIGGTPGSQKSIMLGCKLGAGV